MNRIYLITALLLLSRVPALPQQLSVSDTSAGQRQDLVKANAGPPVHKLKNADQLLPRWSFDLAGHCGWLKQDICLIDLKRSYSPNNQPESQYSTPEFSNGRGVSGNLIIGYFWGKRRLFGFGIGGIYSYYTGDMSMANFYSDFQNTDAKGYIYRQIIRTVENEAIHEHVTFTNINIPVLFRFKHQFKKPNNLGISADIGPVFGVFNQTKSEATALFNYEAIYKIDGSNNTIISQFDPTWPPNTATSLVLTESAYVNAGHDTSSVAGYFDKLRSQSTSDFNVGLRKTIAPSESVQKESFFSKLNYGALAQICLTDQVTYNLAFQLGGYFMYQSWRNVGNEENKLTTRVFHEQGAKDAYNVDYRPMTSVIEHTDYHSYGISFGVKISFGEKRDVDGDGVPDEIDRCKYDSGMVRFRGCPDADNDGIPDIDDGCPYAPGEEGTNGCPDDDRDGIPDTEDQCPHEFGELRNGCPISKDAKAAIAEKENALLYQGADSSISNFSVIGCAIANSVRKEADSLEIMTRLNGSALLIFRKTTFTRALAQLRWYYERNKAVPATDLIKDESDVLCNIYMKIYIQILKDSILVEQKGEEIHK